MTNYQKNFLLILLLVILMMKDYALGVINASKVFNLTDSQVSNMLNQELATKYQELTNSYNYNDFYPENLEHSKILYRTFYNFNKTITIYKGTKQNIKPKMLVINDQGLVGIINKCFLNSSEVILLTSSLYVLPVKINDYYGELSSFKDKLIVKGIKKSNEVKEGDLVYTSDLSIYPSPILIGKISSISLDNYELEKILEIEPAVNFNKLNYVSIIPILRGQE